MEDKNKRSGNPSNQPIPTAEEIASCIERRNRQKTTWATFGVIACISIGIIGLEVQKQNRVTDDPATSSKPLIVIAEKPPQFDHRGIPKRNLHPGALDDSYQIRTLLEENRHQSEKIKNLTAELEKIQHQLEEAQILATRSQAEPQNAKIVEMGRELRKRELANQALKKQTALLEQELAESQSKAKEIEMNLDTMMALFDESTGNKEQQHLTEELESQRSFYHNEIALLEKNLTKTNGQSQLLEQRLKEARNENELLEHEIWHYNTLLSQKDQELNQKEQAWIAKEEAYNQTVINLAASVELEQTVAAQLQEKLKTILAKEEHPLDDYLALMEEKEALQNLCTLLAASQYEVDSVNEQLAKETYRVTDLIDQLNLTRKEYDRKVQECEHLAKQLDEADSTIQVLSKYKDNHHQNLENLEGNIETYQLAQLQLAAKYDDLQQKLAEETFEKNQILAQFEEQLAKYQEEKEQFIAMEKKLAGSIQRAERAEREMFSTPEDQETLLHAYSEDPTEQQIAVLTAAMKKLHRVEADLNNAKRREAEKESAINALTAEAKAIEQEAEKMVSLLFDQLDKETASNSQLQDQLNQLFNEKDEKNQLIATLEKELQLFRNESHDELSRIQVESLDLHEQIELLQGANQEAIRKIASLSQSLSDSFDTRRELKEKMAYLERDLLNAEDNCHHYEQTIAKLETEVSDLSLLASALANKELEVDEILQSNAVLSKSLREKQNENLALMQQRDELGHELEKLIAYKEDSFSKFDEYQERIHEVEQELAGLETQKNLYQDRIAELNSLIVKISSDNDSFEDAMAKSDRQVEELQQQLAEAQLKFQKEEDELLAILQTEKNKVKEREKSIEFLLAMQTETETKVKTLQESMTASQQESLNRLENEREIYKDEVARLTSELLSHQSRVKELEWAISENQTETDKILKSYGAAKDDLLARNESLKGQLDAMESETLKQVELAISQKDVEIKEILESYGAAKDYLVAKNEKLKEKLKTKEQEIVEQYESDRETNVNEINRLKQELLSYEQRQLELERAIVQKEEEIDQMVESYSTAKKDLMEKNASLQEQLAANEKGALNRLENERQMYSDEIAKLKFALSETYANYENDAGALQKEMARAQDELAAATWKVDALRKELASQEIQSQELEKLVSLKEEEIKRIIASYDTAKETLAAKNEDLCKQLEEKSATIEELYALIHSAEVELDQSIVQKEKELERVLQSYGAAKEDLLAKNAELHAQLEEKNGVVNELRIAIDTMEINQNELQKYAKATENELAQALEQAQRKEAELLAKQEKLLSELERKLEDEIAYQEHIEEMKYAEIVKDNQLQELASSLHLAQQALKETQADFSATQQQLTQLHDRYKAANRELAVRNEELMSELGQQKQVSSELGYKIKDIIASREDIYEQLTHENQTVEQLKNQYENAMTIHDKTQEEMHNLRMQLIEANELIAMTQYSIEQTKLEFDETKRVFEVVKQELKNKNEELAGQLKEKHDQVLHLQSEIAKMISQRE